MVFKPSTVQRSASAVKNLWGGGGTNQQVPSFFVSTPQFKRQQRQVGPYAGGARTNSGKAHGLRVRCCPSVQYTSTSSILDDERYEKDRVNRSPFVPKQARASISELRKTADTQKVDIDEGKEVTELVPEQLGSEATLAAFNAMQEAGQHGSVLNAFEELEQRADKDIPVEIYNCMMRSLAALAIGQQQDATVVLQVYQRILSRGVVPNSETYAVVIDTLINAAENFAERRKALEPVIGSPEVLESASEAWETLSVEDHLRLAAEIFRASTSVDSANFEQDVALRLFNSLVDHDMFSEARSLEEYVKTGKLLVCETPNELQEAYDGRSPSDFIRTAFRLGRPDMAMAEFARLGAPAHLVERVLVGFASSGLLATAVRWARQAEATGGQLNSCLEHATSDADQVGSAVALFEKLVVDYPVLVTDRARCAFLRIARKDVDALMVGIKESHLSNAQWDPSTLIETCEALVSFNEPLLAVDIFVWQGRRLEREWRTLNMQSFAGEEILSRLVHTLRANNQLSLNVSVQLAQLPFVTSGFDSRTAIFKPLWEARITSPGLLELSDAELAGLLSIQANWVVNAESRLGLSLPIEEVNYLGSAFPLFAEDCIKRKLPMTSVEIANIGRALELLGAEYALQRQWAQQVTAPRSDLRPTNVSEMIRYANTDNGIDFAVETLQKELLRGVVPSVGDVARVIEVCGRDQVPLAPVIEMLEQRIPPTESSWWIPVLDAIVEHAAKSDFGLAEQAHLKLLALGSHPSATSYAQLIQYGSESISTTVQIFNEARSRGVLPNTFLYNVVLAKLARARRDPELHMLWDEMESLGIAKTSVTYGTMIAASCRAHDISNAHKLFKEMESQPSYVPKVAPFNMLMQYYVHTDKNRAAAVATFERLRLSGCLPSIHTYRLLIEAWLLDPPNLDEADNVLRIMKEDGAPMSTSCFAALVWGRGVLLRDFNSAISFYRGLVKNSRVKPDRKIFKALLETYVKNDQIKETPLILEEMSQYGVSVDKELLDILVAGWASVDKRAASRLQNI